MPSFELHVDTVHAIAQAIYPTLLACVRHQLGDPDFWPCWGDQERFAAFCSTHDISNDEDGMRALLTNSEHIEAWIHAELRSTEWPAHLYPSDTYQEDTDAPRVTDLRWRTRIHTDPRLQSVKDVPAFEIRSGEFRLWRPLFTELAAPTARGTWVVRSSDMDGTGERTVEPRGTVSAHEGTPQSPKEHTSPSERAGVFLSDGFYLAEGASANAPMLSGAEGGCIMPPCRAFETSALFQAVTATAG